MLRARERLCVHTFSAITPNDKYINTTPNKNVCNKLNGGGKNKNIYLPRNIIIKFWHVIWKIMDQ